MQAKRDEFWDTAPAFDGRKEIWDALRASAHALESGDHQLAQAILNGANISLPNGQQFKNCIYFRLNNYLFEFIHLKRGSRESSGQLL